MSCFVKLLFVVALFAFLSTSRAVKLEEDIKLISSLSARRGFRAYQAAMTCDRNIKVCGGKGRRGRNCCQKKCVDLKTNRYNCGRCGKRCKYSEICCNGKCLNPMFNRNHCGGCNSKCSRGSFCVYGMCGYA